MAPRRNPSRLAALAALLLALPGCGGGSGASSPAPPAPAETVLLTATVRADGDRVRSGAGCVADIDALKSCIGFNNLAAPTQVLGPFDAGSTGAAPFFERTGVASGRIFAVAGPSSDAAAADSFVQVADAETFGIHVVTRNGTLSSINPLFQFDRLAPAAGATDTRVFPWGGAFGSDVVLEIAFDLRLRRISATPGSAAYGQAVLDLFDRNSGGHFYFLAHAFGTIAPPAAVLRDSASGKVIVPTTFGPAAAYGTSLGATTRVDPSGFVSPEAQGSGGHYVLRITRADFQRVLDAARTMEPTLSASPGDYMLDDYHFNNEIAGDGEIGVNLGAMTLRLIRP